MEEQKPTKNEKCYQCPTQGREQLGLHKMRMTSARVVLVKWGLVGGCFNRWRDAWEMEG